MSVSICICFWLSMLPLQPKNGRLRHPCYPAAECWCASTQEWQHSPPSNVEIIMKHIPLLLEEETLEMAFRKSYVQSQKMCSPNIQHSKVGRGSRKGREAAHVRHGRMGRVASRTHSLPSIRRSLRHKGQPQPCAAYPNRWHVI